MRARQPASLIQNFLISLFLWGEKKKSYFFWPNGGRPTGPSRRGGVGQWSLQSELGTADQQGGGWGSLGGVHL